MESESSRGTFYRLVVAVDDREEVYAAPLFRCYRRARAHVSQAVCQHASHGAVHAITLQRGVTPETSAPPWNAPAYPCEPNPDVLDWAPMARWETDVITRILDQNRLSWPALPARSAATAPPAAAEDSGAPPPCAAAEPSPDTLRPATGAPGERVDDAVAADEVGQPAAEAVSLPVEAETAQPEAALATIDTDAPFVAPLSLGSTSGRGAEGAERGSGPQSSILGAQSSELDAAVPDPGHHDARAPRPQAPRPAHNGRRRTRWHIAGTVILLLLVWILSVLAQTDGHLRDLFAWFRPPTPPVATELPFRADGSNLNGGHQPQSAPSVHIQEGPIEGRANDPRADVPPIRRPFPHAVGPGAGRPATGGQPARTRPG